MPPSFNQWSVAFDPCFPIWGYALLGIAFLAGLFFHTRSSARLSQVRVRVTLFILRFFLILFVWLILFRPSLELRRAEEIPGSIAIMVDRSASMALKTENKSRAEMVKDFLQESKDTISKMTQRANLQYYYFSDELQETNLEFLAAKETQSHFPRTDVGSALQDLHQKHAGSSRALNAVLLFSDGADRGSLALHLNDNNMLNWLRDEHIPLYTFQPGKEGAFRDLRVGQIYFDEFGFVKTPLMIEADIEMEGYESKTVPVTLRDGKEVIATSSVELKGDGTSTRVKFRMTPQYLGPRIYTITLPQFADETIRENNERSFMIRIIRDKIRILHVAGHPSWDEKFLRLSLRADPNIDLIAFYILRTREDVLYDVNEEELSLIPFPHQELFGPELDSFDLVIFQDFAYRKFFPAVYLENVKKYVENGGGFMMLGGGESFQSGEYDATPLAEILPLRMEIDKTFVPSKYRLELSTSGKRHPITRLHPDREKNVLLWSAMPFLEGLNLLGGTLPGSIVLGQAEHRGKSFPLLAVREVMKGRTLTFATDTSWHWNFQRVRDGGTPESYQTFYKNAVRWLIGDPTEALVDVEATRSKRNESGNFQIVVRSRDRSYQANDHAALSLYVSNATGEKIVERKGKTDSQGRFETVLSLEKRGHYFVQAEVTLPGGGKAHGETVLVVEGAQGEWLSPRIQAAFLKTLAQNTGGQYTVLPDKLSLEIKPKLNYRVTDRRLQSLWNTWPVLLATVFLMVAEWWVRRRHGLA